MSRGVVMAGDSAFMQTRSTGLVRVNPPDPSGIDVDDVAHALSQVCRFGGHSSSFFSVAQHCCFVSDHAARLAWVVDAGLARCAALLGLLHDAHEAYTGDVIAPMKRAMRAVSGSVADAYTEVEGDWYRATVEELAPELLDFAPTMLDAHARIGYVDLLALATERRDLFEDPEDWGPLPEPVEARIRPWSPRRARHEFLWRYHGLMGQIGLSRRHAGYALLSRMLPWG